MSGIGDISPNTVMRHEEVKGFDTTKAYPYMVRDVLDLTAEGVLMTNQEGWVTYANAMVLSMLGHDHTQVVGQRVRDLFGEEDVDLAGFLEAMKGMREWTGELGVRCGAAGELALAVSTHPVTGRDGNVVGSVALFVDVTGRREMQERLARYEHLAILGQLTGGVAHELRNSLGLIKGAAHFLDENLADLSPDMATVLNILNIGVEKTDQIVKSLLTVARPTPSSWREVDVNQVAQDALTGADIPESVEVATRLSASLPEIMGDRGQLTLVVDNLIRNALQAMSAGGRLEVKTETPDGEWVIISVADTGSGISEADQRRLFDPLFTKRAGGIGLGLALVRSLTEGHGGHVALQSEVGKGSVFSVHLPTNAEQSQLSESIW